MLLAGCVPPGSLSPPTGDERLIEIPPAAVSAPSVHPPADPPRTDLEEAPSISSNAHVPVGPTPFHVLASMHFPVLHRLGAVVFATAEGRIAEGSGEGLSFDPQLEAGVDGCGEMEMHLFGHFPERAWLQVKFPPSGEHPPRDEVYRFSPGAKRWSKIGARLTGGADLMIWGHALIGYDTHWGGRVPDRSVRLFDGRLPGPLPSYHATPSTNCPNEFGGLDMSSLGDRLMVTKTTCVEEEMRREAVMWSASGQEGSYLPLPLERGDVSSGGEGPIAFAGDDVWVSVDAHGTNGAMARVLHFDGATWQSIVLEALDPLISLSALADGSLWMVSGEVHQGATLWRRDPQGKLERIALPSGIGEPTQVVAISERDVWVACADGVIRTIEPTNLLQWLPRQCDVEGATAQSVTGERQ